MSIKIATAALLSVLAAAPVMAETVTLTAPLEGASLHSGTVDMNIYFTEGADNAFEVFATYLGDPAPRRPRRLIMALQEGDDVSFALPAHPGTLYNFRREGGMLTVTSGPADRPTS